MYVSLGTDGHIVQLDYNSVSAISSIIANCSVYIGTVVFVVSIGQS